MRFVLSKSGVAEMALKEPDMTSCKEKKKCLGGVNSGLAYDPADPCAVGFQLNELSCDCEPESTQARWSGFSYHTNDGEAFFWSTGWLDLSGGQSFAWYGAPLGFDGIFAPVGLQGAGFETGITVNSVASCSGSTIGCKLYYLDANNGIIETYPFQTIYCQCPTGYSGSHSPGCASYGDWEFR